jgi:muconate cycloisomerase
MRITQVNLFRYAAPFTFGFKSSHVQRLQADSIIVELAFDNGLSGWGECVPRPYVTGETPQSVIRLVGNFYPECLFRTDISYLADIRKVLQNLENNCRELGVPYLSALGGVDIALLDALGKLQKKSVIELLGGVVRDRVPYSLSIPILPQSEVHQIIDIAKRLEFRFIKILMGADPDENLRRVKQVRSELGESADIRLEANGSWTVPEAIQNIQKLKFFGISAVEQPVEPCNLEGLREVRNKTGIPVILDESMCHFEDAKRVIAAHACDILNIKISKCGGLLRSRRIADFAKDEGIPCQLGAHVGEASILSRAGECFALTTENITLFEGCSPLLFGSGLVTEGVHLDHPASTGLGIRIRKKELSPVLQRESVATAG